MTISPSHLTTERYHQLSDATMEALLGSLEVLLDSLGKSTFEVEYHVCVRLTHLEFPPVAQAFPERCFDVGAG